MRYTRYIASILLSACLWSILPVLLGILNDKLTPSGRVLFFQGLPKTILFSILFFIPLAALMHWLWAQATLRVSGAHFWILPIKTLPTAILLGWFLMTPIIVVKERLWMQPFDVAGTALLYSLVLGLFVILGSVIWISYPLAILNQIIVRYLLVENKKC